METTKEISRSIHVTIEDIKTKYLESEFIQELKALDKEIERIEKELNKQERIKGLAEEVIEEIEPKPKVAKTRGDPIVELH